MKKIIYFIGAAAMFLAVSCAKEQAPVTEPADNLVQMTFTATTDMATKTSLHTDGKSVNWSDGDKISVFAINEGAVASHTAFAAENINGTTADFTGATDADATDFVALYPYNLAASVTVADGVTTVKTTIPYTQKAVKGGFDPALNVMLATTTKETNHFSFKNLCSLIKVTIPDNLTDITAISFRTRLAMTGTFTYNVTEGTVSASTDNIGKSLTMASEDGSALEPGTYYIVAGPNPSTDATQQIQSLSVTLSDGTVKTIIATKSFTLKSNTIYDLGTVSLDKAKTFIVKNAPNHDFPMKAGMTYKLEWSDIPDDKVFSIKSRSNKVATVSDDGTVTFTGVHGVEFIHVGYGVVDANDTYKAEVEVPVAFNVVPGYYRDSPQDWSTDTANSTMTVENDIATLTFVKQSNNKGRADIKKGKTYINPEYPILCFRLDDMKDKDFTGESIKLDVNYGYPMGHPDEGTTPATGRIWWGTTNYPAWNYKGQFDDGSRLIVFDSSVFSWPNVDAGSGYNRVLPEDEVVCFTKFKIVYADLAPWPTAETDPVPTYRFYGFNTFKTLDEAKAFYGIEITKR